MNLRNWLKDPWHLMTLGMVFLALANVWPRFLYPAWWSAHLGADPIDAVRGFLFGVGIALSLLAARLNGRRRRYGGGE